jgi:site-specific recombinase XerD
MDDIKKLETELRLQKKSEKTIKNYIFFNQKFLEFVKKTSEQISLEDIKQYLASLDQKATATLALAIASLRFYYSKILGKDFFDNFESPKKDKTPSLVLAKEEIKQIIEKADTGKSKLIISFLYATGLKVSELVNLKIQDISPAEKTGIVKTEKGNSRMFILSEKILPNLKDFMDKHPNYQYVFSKEKPLTPRNIQKIVNLAAKKANISKKITPHTMRHSFAAHLLENGVEMKYIQELLGKAESQSADVLKNIKSPLDSL